MALSTLPAAPSVSDPQSTFDSKATALLTALGTMVAEVNGGLAMGAGGVAVVTSAASPLIWAAQGETIDLNNSTPVTCTGLVTGMTSAQIGSSKRIIVRAGQTWTVTASANLSIDGNTSGNNTFPAGSILEVIALSLTVVAFRTVQANGTWTPTDSSGASLGLTLTSTKFSRVGNQVTLVGRVTYPATVNASAASITLPYQSASTGSGRAISNRAGGVSLYLNGTVNMLMLDGLGGATLTNANMSTTVNDIGITYLCA